MAEIYFLETFKGQLKKLANRGGAFSKASEKCQAAITRVKFDGLDQIGLEINPNGENRLPNIRKYRLNDDCRLVLQIIDQNALAFLFVGDHEDTEEWLDSHRGYRWIQSDKDKKLEFTYAPEGNSAKIVRGFDLTSSESDMDKPLLRDLNESELQKLIPDVKLLEYCKNISSNSWEDESSSIQDEILRMANDDKLTECLWTILEIAHENKPDKIQKMRLQIALYFDKAKNVENEKLVEALQHPVNADEFVEFDEDMADFWKEHPNSDWDDWMLFLNSKQKEWSKKELKGAARLLGVSGSGKTCVLLHRAKMLAKKYKQPIAVLTLTGSMTNVLDNLLNRLCGPERGFIKTFTISSFIQNEVLTSSNFRGFTKDFPYAESESRKILVQACDKIFNCSEFQGNLFSKFSKTEKLQFVIDEFAFVRKRLIPDDYDNYCLSSFKRTGRLIPLQENMRKIIIRNLREYEAYLQLNHYCDHDTLNHHGLKLIADLPKLKYRSILIDEVQDLTHNALRLIGTVKDENDNVISSMVDGLFLVGDSAQSIYKNGFSLKKMGININNRSFAFKKNYRNTKQIIEAAYSLIKNFEFSSMDDDSLSKPIEPESITRFGNLPKLIKSYSLDIECLYIAETIKKMQMKNISLGNICIIGMSKSLRDKMTRILDKENIKWEETKTCSDHGNEKVKISTVESAKGLEFSVVFVFGLAVPEIQNQSNEDLSLAASRLYVAMTRACDELYLSYSIGNRYIPSILLSYIEDYCEQQELRKDVNGYKIV